MQRCIHSGPARREACLPAVGFALLLALAMPIAAGAQPSLDVSPDVTTTLGGETVEDHDVATDAAAGVSVLDLGAIPDAADLSAFANEADGAVLIALDITVVLDGVTVGPNDVVRLAPGGTALALDGSTAGVPAGAAIDALAVDGDDLIVSFDITVSVDGVTADDEDLVRWDGADWSLELDGSAAGVPAALDLDAVELDTASGDWLISFDISGSVDGVSFDDEDVLAHDPAAGSWTLVYDGSALHAGWGAADLDALALPGDQDGDGVLDADDNCIEHANADQRDTNQDGFGNRCDPDLNNDGVVGVPDFNAFRGLFGSNCVPDSACEDADFTGENAVGVPDFNILRAFFGGPPGPSGLACAGTVPCP